VLGGPSLAGGPYVQCVDGCCAFAADRPTTGVTGVLTRPRTTRRLGPLALLPAHLPRRPGVRSGGLGDTPRRCRRCVCAGLRRCEEAEQGRGAVLEVQAQPLPEEGQAATRVRRVQEPEAVAPHVGRPEEGDEEAARQAVEDFGTGEACARGRTVASGCDSAGRFDSAGGRRRECAACGSSARADR
jgi:hypothetical protein